MGIFGRRFAFYREQHDAPKESFLHEIAAGTPEEVACARVSHTYGMDITPAKIRAWARSDEEFKQGLHGAHASAKEPGLTRQGICSLNDPRLSEPGEFGFGWDTPYEQDLKERLHPKTDNPDPGYGPSRGSW